MSRKFVILLLVLFACPLRAQQSESPRFFIEEIEVRNAKRVSPEVVISESRLTAGREYSEEQLGDAAARLSRLPFLVSVDFSLEKGSERGRHVLVLSINETKPLFYALDLRPFFEANDAFVSIDYGDRIGTTENEAALGFRWFVGRRGVAHIGFFGSEDRDDFIQDRALIAIGYTQYDLFGTRAFATFNLKRPIDGSGGVITPELVVGMPVTTNQTITLQVDETRSESERNLGGDEFARHSGQRVVRARWSYNTTNHPFFPTQGSIYSVAPAYAQTDSVWTDTRYEANPDGPGYIPVLEHLVTHSNVTALELSARRYVEISERNSVSGGIDATLARLDVRETRDGLATTRNVDGSSVAVHAGFAHSLWDRERRRDGDSLVEINLRYVNRENTDDGRGFFRPADDVTQLSASWVRRSSWGTLRLGAGYAW